MASQSSLTATGKNLLKIRDVTQTIRGVTVTAKDGVVALKGTATETGWTFIDVDSFVLDGTYILSSNITGIAVVLANKSFKAVLNQNNSKTLENEEASKVCFTVTKGKTYDISNILVQIEKGSKATSYEPYTGGKPSPNPDYPQEIKRVVNPVVKVCGKNLLQPNLRYNDRAKINIKKGTKLTLICKNGVVSKGGNLKFETANGEIAWFGFDKGSVKQQIMLYDDVVAFYYLFNSEPSESYALYIGDENTYEPYKEQSVQLPYTLNAIPVASGGNVTIDGQQWVCDEVDLERGVKVQRVKVKELNPGDKWSYQKLASGNNNFQIRILNADMAKDSVLSICNILPFKNVAWDDSIQNLPKIYANNAEITVSFPPSSEYSSLEAFKQLLTNVKSVIYYALATPIETPLTPAEIAAFNALTTYYPVTNISVTSDQLDGYTVFNYPISMANGWNYVKQQLGDTRDYIYDMDAKAQDIDIQSAEAYVNSEYAVVLTELEV